MHDLVYHGGGGFIHSEVYNMPVWMRRFHIERIHEYLKEQEKEHKKQASKAKSQASSIPSRPNINPSTIYNTKR